MYRFQAYWCVSRTRCLLIYIFLSVAANHLYRGFTVIRQVIFFTLPRQLLIWRQPYCQVESHSYCNIPETSRFKNCMHSAGVVMWQVKIQVSRRTKPITYMRRVLWVVSAAVIRIACVCVCMYVAPGDVLNSPQLSYLSIFIRCLWTRPCCRRLRKLRTSGGPTEICY